MNSYKTFESLIDFLIHLHQTSLTETQQYFFEHQPNATLHKHCYYLPDYFRLYSTLDNMRCHTTQAMTNIFLQCCQENPYTVHYFQPDTHSYDVRYEHCQFGIGQFVLNLQSRLHQIPNTILYEQQRKIQERTRAMQQYISDLFNVRCRMVVIRLDLSYQNGFRNDFNRAVMDLHRLMANQRSNRIFEGLRGYVAKLEWGLDKGMHWHLLMLFDGSIRKDDAAWYISKELGDYWLGITGNEGFYFNCNTQNYPVNALGEIHRNNTPEKLNALIYTVVPYLRKESQSIQPIGQSVRLIRRGQV